MRIHCKTNLDISRVEDWPSDLPEVPRVGDVIESSFRHRNGFRLMLKVVRIVWEFQDEFLEFPWVPVVELGINLHQTPTEFHDWYNRMEQQ